MEYDKFELSGKAFDYVIAGGGTAGLCLAAYLSEDQSNSVLVLEAGQANLNDPMILTSARIAQTYGNPQYDWAFHTLPQKNSGNREVFFPRGKSLGGSSAMNLQAWILPPAADFNAFTKLGNGGWTWDELVGYAKSLEQFHPPTEDQLKRYPYAYVPEQHGIDGPLQTSFPYVLPWLDTPLQDAMGNMGIRHRDDHLGGDNVGVWTATSSLDPKLGTRSYAATAFYQPNADRKNLVVVTSAYVNRVLLSRDGGEQLRADGVEFTLDDHPDRILQVKVKREVIICAGALKSPQILELSGIGSASLLQELGVPVNIDLPGVGENLQEHTHIAAVYELDKEKSEETLESLVNASFAAQEALKFENTRSGMLTWAISNFAYAPIQTLTDRTEALVSQAADEISAKRGQYPPGLMEQYELQLSALKNPSLPDCEIFNVPVWAPGPGPREEGKLYTSLFGLPPHPFSRGSVHIKSVNPRDSPAIDPKYFSMNIDMDMFVENFKWMRRLSQTEPFKSLVAKEASPGVECSTDEQIREYIRQYHETTFHTCGTTSMLPREKNGVVDSSLKVYGTSNLRVADIGILPLHIAAHTQAAAYVVGRKAADIILASKDE